MEIYRPVRKKNRSNILKILFIYCVLIISNIISNTWFATVVAENDQYPASIIETGEGREIKKYTQEKGQKYLVLTEILKDRISTEGFSLGKQAPNKGDIVMVKLDYPILEEKQTFHSRLTKFIKQIAAVATFGIIKHPKNLVLRTIAALPGDTIVYNTKKVLMINNIKQKNYEPSDIKAKDMVPYIDQKRKITLNDNEIFLVRNQEYGIDDKFMGPSVKEDIIGKAILLLGPKWGLISNFTNN